MNRPQIIANGFNTFAIDNTLHIYDDGYVLALTCSQSRHKKIVAQLRQQYGRIESAVSSDGFLSVFLIFSVPPANPDSDLFLVDLSDGFKDHRLDDCNTIDLIAEWFARGPRVS